MQLSLHEVRHFVKKKKKEKTSGKQDQNVLFCNLKKKNQKNSAQHFTQLSNKYLEENHKLQLYTKEKKSVNKRKQNCIHLNAVFMN